MISELIGLAIGIVCAFCAGSLILDRLNKIRETIEQLGCDDSKIRIDCHVLELRVERNTDKLEALIKALNARFEEGDSWVVKQDEPKAVAPGQTRPKKEVQKAGDN